MIEARKLLATNKNISVLHLDRIYSEQFVELLYYLGATTVFLFEDKSIVVVADYTNHKKILLECIKAAPSIDEISKNVFQCRIN
jgi:hypothetical protein